MFLTFFTGDCPYIQNEQLLERKVAVQVSVLLGNILKQGVRNCWRNEEIDEEVRWAKINSEVLKYVSLQGQPVTAWKLKHIKIIIENAKNEECKLFGAGDWAVLVEQINGSSGVEVITRVIKVLIILFDMTRDEAVEAYAAAVDSRMAELLGALGSIPQDSVSNETWLKFFKHVTKLLMTVNNVVTQSENKIRVEAEIFYNICFNKEKSGIFKLIELVYFHPDDFDEKFMGVAEDVIGNSLDYFRGLLEDPYIWASDLAGFGHESPDSEKVEAFISENLFTQARVTEMLQTITEKYLILTPQEIEKWKESSLEFYINQKEQANDVSGNYLREKCQLLIASIELRFGAHFNQFCEQLGAELQKPEL